MTDSASTRTDGPRRQSRDWSLADQVYEQILTRIVDGLYPTNSKLPAETALSASLGVSRPVLRQALKQLREDGVIQSQQGSGSYVRQRPDKAILKFSQVGSIADIQRTFEFRAAIEAEAAALAALRWTKDSFAAIQDTFDALEKRIETDGVGAEEDEAFHQAICKAADNHYFLSTINSMRAQTLLGMNLARSLSLERPRERLRMVQNEHRAILKALLQRDATAAKHAMRAHVDNARKRVFEGAVDADPS